MPKKNLEKDLGLGDMELAEIFTVILPDIFEIDFPMSRGEEMKVHKVDDIIDYVACELRKENRFFDAREE